MGRKSIVVKVHFCGELIHAATRTGSWRGSAGPAASTPTALPGACLCLCPCSLVGTCAHARANGWGGGSENAVESDTPRIPTVLMCAAPHTSRACVGPAVTPPLQPLSDPRGRAAAVDVAGRHRVRARRLVGTRTKKQVRSHAQKYFLRLAAGCGGRAEAPADAAAAAAFVPAELPPAPRVLFVCTHPALSQSFCEPHVCAVKDSVRAPVCAVPSPYPSLRSPLSAVCGSLAGARRPWHASLRPVRAAGRKGGRQRDTAGRSAESRITSY